jgi:hypothetical protein
MKRGQVIRMNSGHDARLVGHQDQATVLSVLRGWLLCPDGVLISDPRFGNPRAHPGVPRVAAANNKRAIRVFVD